MANLALAQQGGSNLARANEDSMLAIPTVVGPVTGSIIGAVGAVGAAFADEYFEDKVKAGPLKPSGIGAIACSLVALWSDDADVAAGFSALALGMGAPSIYESTRGAARRAKEKAAAAAPASAPAK